MDYMQQSHLSIDEREEYEENDEYYTESGRPSDEDDYLNNTQIVRGPSNLDTENKNAQGGSINNDISGILSAAQKQKRLTGEGQEQFQETPLYPVLEESRQNQSSTDEDYPYKATNQDFVDSDSNKAGRKNFGNGVNLGSSEEENESYYKTDQKVDQFRGGGGFGGKNMSFKDKKGKAQFVTPNKQTKKAIIVKPSEGGVRHMRINGKDVTVGEPKKTPTLMKSKPIGNVNSGLRGVNPKGTESPSKSPLSNYGGVRQYIPGQNRIAATIDQTPAPKIQIKTNPLMSLNKPVQDLGGYDSSFNDRSKSLQLSGKLQLEQQLSHPIQSGSQRLQSPGFETKNLQYSQLPRSVNQQKHQYPQSAETPQPHIPYPVNNFPTPSLMQPVNFEGSASGNYQKQMQDQINSLAQMYNQMVVQQQQMNNVPEYTAQPPATNYPVKQFSGSTVVSHATQPIYNADSSNQNLNQYHASNLPGPIAYSEVAAQRSAKKKSHSQQGSQLGHIPSPPKHNELHLPQILPGQLAREHKTMGVDQRYRKPTERAPMRNQPHVQSQPSPVNSQKFDDRDDHVQPGTMSVDKKPTYNDFKPKFTEVKTTFKIGGAPPSHHIAAGGKVKQIKVKSNGNYSNDNSPRLQPELFENFSSPDLANKQFQRLGYEAPGFEYEKQDPLEQYGIPNSAPYNGHLPQPYNAYNPNTYGQAQQTGIYGAPISANPIRPKPVFKMNNVQSKTKVQYNLKDYKTSTKQNKVGDRLAQGLGDNIGTDEWEVKHKKLQAVRDFSNQLRTDNKVSKKFERQAENQMANKFTQKKQSIEQELYDKRKEYGKSVPKPKTMKREIDPSRLAELAEITKLPGAHIVSKRQPHEMKSKSKTNLLQERQASRHQRSTPQLNPQSQFQPAPNQFSPDNNMGELEQRRLQYLGEVAKIKQAYLYES